MEFTICYEYFIWEKGKGRDKKNTKHLQRTLSTFGLHAFDKYVHILIYYIKTLCSIWLLTLQ